MKLIFVFVSLVFSTSIFAQVESVKQAVVYTTMNVIAPEEEDVQNIQNQQGGGFNFRNMMDGETKFTTFLKNDMVKTVIKSEMGRATILRDNAKKITTTLMEIMGNKTGFYITDEEQEKMKEERKRKRDSIMEERRKKDSTLAPAPAATTPVPVEISYTEEQKKIGGYNCKKAYVISTRLLGLKDTTVIWFTTEIKLQNLVSTGGLSAFANMGAMMTEGFDKVDGFIMRYESKMPRNRKMEVEVTKIDLKKEIEDKEFDIPKDFDVKPMKEMRGMFGQGGMQFRGN